MPYSSMFNGARLAPNMKTPQSMILLCTAVIHTASECNTCIQSTPGTALLQQNKHIQRHTLSLSPEEEGMLVDHDGWHWWRHQEVGIKHNVTPVRKEVAASAPRVFSALSTHSSAVAAGHVNNVSRPITFITVKDQFFDTNLGTSSLWINRFSLPHQWIVLENGNNTGISKLYAHAQTIAQHPLMVYLHPDVILPNEWYEQFLSKLAQIEAFDPSWGALGTAGVPSDWKPYDMPSKIATSISDGINGDFTTGVDNLPVQSLDEHLLVLRKGSPLFDPNLPGFDLYGTDIVLSARLAGMKSYLLNINVKHKTVNAEGAPYDGAIWWAHLSDPAFASRAAVSIQYEQNKWAISGLLPTFGTAFDVVPPPK